MKLLKRIVKCVSVLKKIGQSFLWCGWEQDPERLLHIWGIKGEIVCFLDLQTGSFLSTVTSFYKYTSFFFYYICPRKDLSQKFQLCITKMPPPLSSSVSNWWAKSMFACYMFAVSNHLFLRSVICVNSIMIMGVCRVQDITHTNTGEAVRKWADRAAWSLITSRLNKHFMFLLLFSLHISCVVVCASCFAILGAQLGPAMNNCIVLCISVCNDTYICCCC